MNRASRRKRASRSNNENSNEGRGSNAGRGGRSNSGRGRGNSGRGTANAGRGGKRPPPARKLPPSISRPTAPVKKNGEKGAEVFTVSEKERIDLTRLLMDLRETDQLRLELPPTLTNTERKFVHQLAGQLGLTSKSSGKGENRRITVTKRNDTVKKLEEEDIPLLKVGKRGSEALKKHIQQFPPTHTEELESHETGASLVEAFTQQGNDEEALGKTLNQLGLQIKKEAASSAAPIKQVDLERRKRHHAAAQKRKRTHRSYKSMLRERAKLPAHHHQQEIVDTVRQNQVTIISGETGCGKSTQAPQFLLDANPTASIVVTQPRRISAISIGERVAQEQCLEPVGDMIGYQVRLESAVSRDTQLLFLTPGVLLRKLTSSPLLNEFTHVVIDEIHERDRYTEFLLITLRDLLPRRPDLRIVLMSATLQTQALVDYFDGFPDTPALVHMKGRTFPVQAFYLEQVLRMTGYIDASGGDTTMEQLEADLAKLTQSYTSTNGRANKQPAATDSSLTCVMCGKSGFADALELGTHVALCDGGGETMEVVDKRLRGMTGFAVPNEAPAMATDAEFEDYDVDDDEESDDADSNKWDGESEFQFIEPPGPTLTEEELLNQYQAMHDDEQVDYSLLLEVVQFIAKSSHGDGAILVFFPGWQEISEFTLLLENTAPFHNPHKYLVLPLHSGIPSRDQRKVLQRPPSGVRKIVLSTNIAETSLTIDDVSFVVDTGRAKEKSYDPHLKTSTLQSAWISQASAKQRRGRAGRTKAGVCFHLFSSRRLTSLRPFVESELLRTPLEEMCLMCKKLDLAPGGPEDGDGVPAFLAKAMSAPHAKSVSNALELLVDLGAMEPETNNLTNLGICLSVLSLEPRVGKMVIWAYLLGCARVAANMGVSMSYKSPFVLPPTSMRRSADTAKVQLSQGSESDQVTVLYALRKRDQLVSRSAGAYHSFCRQHFLGTSTMEMVADLRRNLTRELTSLGFANPMSSKEYHNRHDNDHALWQAAIAAGLYPNVASRRRGEVNFSTMTNRKAKIHVSSVNAVRGQPLNAKCEVPAGEIEFVAFGEMVRGANFFTMSQTTHLSSPLPLLLLCGTSLSVRPFPEDRKHAILDVDDWILFKCGASLASQIVILRKRLDAAFWHSLANPSSGLDTLSGAERHAVEILGTLLQSAHRSAPNR